MPRPLIGFHGGSEQFPPGELVELAVAAEAAGFEGFSISDHLHPWQPNQGHAGHAWLTLGAIGARTERLVLGTAVTCPIYRYHPVEIAHGFATLASMFPGRVFLGVGTGEAVNEAPTGGWGPYRERAERLVESIAIMRRLWSEEWVVHEGEHYTVSGASIYDRPASPPPIYVAASGPKSARIAGLHGDGWITDPGTARNRPDVADAFASAVRDAGKESSARVVELWCVAGDREEALACAPKWLLLPVFNDIVNVPDPREVHRIARELSSPERVVDGWLVSPKPEAHIAAIEDLTSRGATHIFVHSPQEDQRRVIDFYSRDVLPALGAR